MVKKILLIGLLCIGVTAFMASQVSAGCCCNPRFCAKWLKGSVEGKFTVFGDVDGAPVEARVFGAEEDGRLKGTVFCVRVPGNGNPKVLEYRIKKCSRLLAKGHKKSGHKKGERKGWKWGWGHGKGICRYVQDVEIDTNSNSKPFVEVGKFEDCDEQDCKETVIISFDELGGEDGQGQEACDDANGEGKTVFAGFIPDEQYVQAEVLDEFDCVTGEPLVITELCTETGENIYDCMEADPEDIPGYGGYGGYGGEHK
jgi:hypothetical protein